MDRYARPPRMPSRVKQLQVKLISEISIHDRLCGLVIRVSAYSSRGPGFDFLRYQIFWEVVGLERGPLSLVRITEELLDWKSSGSWSRKPRLRPWG
jgi:hypothetical protein